MHIQNLLIKWYVRAVQRPHRHPQRKRRPRIIQMTQLFHRMLIEHGSDLARLKPQLMTRKHFSDFLSARVGGSGANE